jgi:hypothetical protein
VLRPPLGPHLQNAFIDSYTTRLAQALPRRMRSTLLTACGLIFGGGGDVIGRQECSQNTFYREHILRMNTQERGVEGT